MLKIIMAVDSNNGIGLQGNIPWHYKEDLRLFRQATKGHNVIMGRNTWESNMPSPLPYRKNIVITSTIKKLDGAKVFNNAKLAFLHASMSKEIYWFIGGASMFNLALVHANELYLSRIDKDYSCDCFLDTSKVLKYFTNCSYVSLSNKVGLYRFT